MLEAARELHRHQERRARVALRRALELAAPEGLRRPFREAPTAVRELLAADPQLVQRHAWLGLDPARRTEGDSRPPRHVIQPESIVDGQVIEPLTAKEQEVLGHLAELLSTEEIAATMFVSVNTVRTHIRSILRKLAVTRRNEAVRRARALSLIGD
jgi:LuxR family maltose regulon positive regulatory protein